MIFMIHEYVSSCKTTYNNNITHKIKGGPDIVRMSVNTIEMSKVK